MTEDKSKLDIEAIRDTLNLREELINYYKKYNIAALQEIIKSLGLFGVALLDKNLKIDSVEENRASEQPSLKPPVETNKPGAYESDSPDKFGMYGAVMRHNNGQQIDTSIYNNQPEVLSKVVGDMMNTPPNEPLGESAPPVEPGEEHGKTLIRKIPNPWEGAGRATLETPDILTDSETGVPNIWGDAVTVSPGIMPNDKMLN